MTRDMFVRRADLQDFHAILGIEQSSVEAPHWSESTWRAVLTNEEVNEPLRATFLAEFSSRVVGFVVVSFAGGMAELESVAVGNAVRRQGVGKALCISAMVWAREHLAEVIGLEVRMSSVGALALYRSLGFAERGIRKGYYRDPIEDAVMMFAPLGK